MDDQCADRLGLKVKTVEDVAAQVLIGLEELRGMFTTMSEGKTHGVQHPAR
jgi:hypothetical protein